MSLTEILIGAIITIVGGFLVYMLTEYLRKRKRIKPGAHGKDGDYPLSDPKYIMGIRAYENFGFNTYYYRRTYLDNEIHSRIEKHQSLSG